MGTIDTAPTWQIDRAEFIRVFEKYLTEITNIFAGTVVVTNLTEEQKNAFYFAIALNQFCDTEIFTDDGGKITI